MYKQEKRPCGDDKLKKIYILQNLYKKVRKKIVNTLTTDTMVIYTIIDFLFFWVEVGH